jgi:hypothetical protein
MIPRIEIPASRLVVTTAASDDGTGGDLFVRDVGVAGAPTVAFAG